MKNLLLAFLLFLFSENISKAQCYGSITYVDSAGTVNFFDTMGTTWLNYMWDFGDGATSTIASPTHTYSSPGVYEACFTGSGMNGCVFHQCINVGINTPVINTLIYVNPIYASSCSLPQTIPFMFYFTPKNYASNDSLYNCRVEFGDGMDTTFTVISFGSYQQTMYHTYTIPGVYNINSTVFNLGTDTCTYSSPPLVLASSCGIVSGRVYNDLNTNCIYDGGEELGGIPVQALDGNLILGSGISDSTGSYSFNISATVSPIVLRVNAANGSITHFTPACPSSGLITILGVPSSNNDFGVTCSPGFDLQGYMTSWGIRPGFTGTVCFSGFNRFCNTPAGQAQVIFDSRTTPILDSSAGYSVSGDTVTFPITPGSPTFSFCVPVSVSVGAVIGDSVCYDFEIQPVAGDSVPSNNTGHICFVVRGSYDPNDKSVDPAGEGAEHIIRPSTPMTYTVRFQNTGNADAINVFILDTLDADLDVLSLEILGSSHTMMYSLLPGNILRFDFSNINLPDSNANEPASHGYVMYRINHVNNIADLSQISNTAYIYFDFNAPVVTNTVTNKIDFSLDIPKQVHNASRLLLYPNPTNNVCHLRFNEKAAREIIVINILGAEVLRMKSGGNEFNIDTHKLPEGIYTVTIYEKKNRMESVKMIVRH
jgi:uncharacterized repeat protein (TIGR01451 family)